jgi:isocitrate/isopropylmalate dehydrogenase
VQVLEAAGAPVRWERCEAGLGALDHAANGLPDETLALIRRNRVALKGPTATPEGGGHKSVNVTIRKALELYANVRPVASLPGVETRNTNVDLVIVRENVEDTYGGIEHRQTPEVVQCLKVITRPGSLAVIRYAFELARAWCRRRVTCLHKANTHKLSDGLFLECFCEVAADYPEIATDDLLVDNACMQLVTALLLSAVQMLRYLGQHGHVRRIEAALRQALAQAVKTRDLGGRAGTEDFTGAVFAALPPAAAGDDQPRGAARADGRPRVAGGLGGARRGGLHRARRRAEPARAGGAAAAGHDLESGHEGVPRPDARNYAGRLALLPLPG